MFKDVSPERWSAKDIKRVANAGLIAGYPDGNSVEQGITREGSGYYLRLTFRMCLLDGIIQEYCPVLPFTDGITGRFHTPLTDT